MEDPGLLVLPTHRLFRGLPAMTAGELAARLGDCFTTRPAGAGPRRRPARVGGHRDRRRPGHAWASSRQKDQQWTLARLTAAGRARMAELAKDHSPSGEALGVSILHRLVDREAAGRRRSCPSPSTCTWSRKWWPGFARASSRWPPWSCRPRSNDIRTISCQRRADAGQEHVFLSEAAERPGHQSAGVRGEKAEGGGRQGEGGRWLGTPRPPAASGGEWGAGLGLVAGAVHVEPAAALFSEPPGLSRRFRGGGAGRIPAGLTAH